MKKKVIVSHTNNLFANLPLHSSASNKVEDYGKLEDNLDALCLRYEVADIRPLKSERLLAPIIIFIKNIIRKCLSFYISPIVKDQNDNNSIIASCIEDISFNIAEMRERILTLENENLKLKEQLNKLS